MRIRCPSGDETHGAGGGRRRHFLHGIVGAVAIAGGVFLAPSQALSYNADVHFSVTMWLAELAGFSSADAFEIAKYDQATDDDPVTGPEGLLWPIGVQRRELFHFIGARRATELRAAAADCKSRLDHQRVGQYLHAIQDTYSHKDYGATIGHILDLHTPDLPWHAPNQFRDMVEKTFNELIAVRGACPFGPVATRPNELPEAMEKIKQWAGEHAPDVRGFPDDPERWKALMVRVYGSHSEYTGKAWAGYAAWLADRLSRGWK